MIQLRVRGIDYDTLRSVFADGQVLSITTQGECLIIHLSDSDAPFIRQISRSISESAPHAVLVHGFCQALDQWVWV